MSSLADVVAPARSWLFVPANSPRMIEKALATPADAVVFDLEDAVPAAEKAAAREALSRRLSAAVSGPGQPRRYVRVNHPSARALFDADLACVAVLPVEGAFLPKVDSLEELRDAIAALEAAEKRADRRAGVLRIVVMIEGPRGLLAAASLAAASPRVAGLAFGAEDFAQAMGLPLALTADAEGARRASPLHLYARSAVAVAAAAAGIEAVDMVWTDFADSDSLAAEAAQARRLGFTGKLAIHPAQLDAINAAFTPSGEEVAYARGVVEAFDTAQAKGAGVATYRGAMIDEPIVKRARRILRRRDVTP